MTTILDEKRLMVRYVVQHDVVCPVSGEILDERTCVPIGNEKHVVAVVAPKAWASTPEELKAKVFSMGYEALPNPFKESA